MLNFPSLIREHLAVVPPISRAMMFFIPSKSPKTTDPYMPLDGPDSTSVIGF